MPRPLLSLDRSMNKLGKVGYSLELQCTKIHQIGDMSGSPYVRVFTLREIFRQPLLQVHIENMEFNFIVDKMDAKLIGWKRKHLSLAGRNTLIKSVTLALPSYTMQTFLLPVSLCDKIDKIYRRFLWGAREDRKRYLSLQAWDNICVPKQVGGLGIRRARDMNVSYITKLGWKMCTETNRLWVKLVRSKYLRNRPNLDFQRTSKASFWVWNGITKCKESLENGMCFRIGQNFRVRITKDSWIPKLPQFKVPSQFEVLEIFYKVGDLMNEDKISWNGDLVQALFPPNISKLILSILIFLGENDKLIWTPSSSWIFSVRSSYRVNNRERFSATSRSDRKVWLLLWKSIKHERHKVVVWKILNNVFPTKDQIKSFTPVLDYACFLCNFCIESIDHLVVDFPIAISYWIQSPWKIHINPFKEMGHVKWMQILLDQNNPIPIKTEEKQRMLHFAAILFEQMWMMRNMSRLGETVQDWAFLIDHMSRLISQYWTAAKNRLNSRRGLIHPSQWLPPPLGEYKLNFDASFFDSHATTTIVLRDHQGIVLGAWINHFFSSNPFCAEMEVAIQAFKVANDMKLQRVWFEGDAMQVVLTLHGVEQFVDWRTQHNIEIGKALLRNHAFWSINYVHRSCNFFTHNIAAWARNLNVCGYIDVTKIPPELLCDKGGTDYSIEDADPPNA